MAHGWFVISMHLTGEPLHEQVGKDLGNVSGWQQAKAASKHDATVWLVDGRKKNAIPYAYVTTLAVRVSLRDTIARV